MIGRELDFNRPLHKHDGTTNEIEYISHWVPPHAKVRKGDFLNYICTFANNSNWQIIKGNYRVCKFF